MSPKHCSLLTQARGLGFLMHSKLWLKRHDTWECLGISVPFPGLAAVVKQADPTVAMLTITRQVKCNNLQGEGCQVLCHRFHPPVSSLPPHDSEGWCPLMTFLIFLFPGRAERLPHRREQTLVCEFKALVCHCILYQSPDSQVDLDEHWPLEIKYEPRNFLEPMLSVEQGGRDSINFNNAPFNPMCFTCSFPQTTLYMKNVNELSQWAPNLHCYFY